MPIGRHFQTVNGRTVHYRMAGAGPPLLLAHQSPRSSAEYIPMIERWAEHFTCIAPDTPGFGQSDPLPGEPEIDDFGDALLAFLDALGLGRVAAYGFHSGGVILMNALTRAPARFASVAIGGYAIWTDDERAHFGDAYLPPFEPKPYGEHLAWLWSRVLEQSWFFPWFDMRAEARLSVAHADVAKLDATVRDMLDAGDAYRAGYGAVLRAPREIPPPDAVTPPVLIAAYDGDPLQAHIDRLGAMPAGWRAEKVATPAELETLALDHLRAAALPRCPTLTQNEERGFVQLRTDRFDGLIHWRGGPNASLLAAHPPGSDCAAMAAPGVIAIDLPGHGLSDDWPGRPPLDWEAWRAVVQAACEQLGLSGISYAATPAGDPDRLFPDLMPDRFGAYLHRAWQIARARVLFDPWYEANAAHAIAFDPADLAPERLAAAHRTLLNARAARACLIARRSIEEGRG